MTTVRKCTVNESVSIDLGIQHYSQLTKVYRNFISYRVIIEIYIYENENKQTRLKLK